MSQQQPIGPLRRRMIEDMTVRNLSPSTQQSYVNAVANFQPPLRQIARPGRTGGGSRLPAAPDRAEAIVGPHQPGDVRPALLLRGDARAQGGDRAHHLGPRAGQAAPGAERRGGRPVPGGCTGPARPRCLVTAYAAGLRVGEVSRLKTSSSDASCCTSCPTACSASATTASSPMGIAAPSSPRSVACLQRRLRLPTRWPRTSQSARPRTYPSCHPVPVAVGRMLIIEVLPGPRRRHRRLDTS